MTGRESPETTTEEKLQEERLLKFRHEIQRLKDEEMRKKAETNAEQYNPHFDDIDPNDLERKEYEAFRDLELMEGDMLRGLRSARRKEMPDNPTEPELKKWRSIDTFWAYLANAIYGSMEKRNKYGKKHL